MGQAADLPRPPPQIPDHELLHPIGRGAYGQVWLARNVMGTLRAVKAVYRQDFGEPQPFEREYKGIQKFEPVSRSHEGLIDILQIGRNEAEGYFYYVMELADAAGAERSNGVMESRSDAKGGRPRPSSPTPQHSSTPVSHHPGTPPLHDSKSGLPQRSITPTLHHPNSYVPHTLRHDVKTRGRLPVNECVELALALTGALQHLHEGGLVHRDIKPSNIIFVKGRPKLADIGLVTDAGDSQSIVGTEGYLPPEGPGTPQADLYSLGKVLYEISTGQDRRQFPDLPPELKGWPDSRAFLELNEVELKACARDVVQRYRSAEEMRADLARLQQGRSIRTRRVLEHAGRLAMRTIPLAVVLALLGILAFNLNLKKSGSAALPSERASVFVLPIRASGRVGGPPNPKGNNFDDSLPNRMTDAVIDSLALIEGIRMGPRKSSWVLRDEAECRREVGEKFGHVVTSTLTNSSGELRWQVSLFQSRPERALWSETFTGGTNDILALEQQVITRIASTLGLPILEPTQRLIDQKLTNNLAAYQEWCRATWLLDSNWTRTNYPNVIDALIRALRLDPNFVDAYHVLARLRKDRGVNDQPPREMFPQATSALDESLKIDDSQLGARFELMFLRLADNYDWDAFEAEFERLQRLYPGNHGCWAICNRSLGRINEARVQQALWEQKWPEDLALRYHGPAARYGERQYEAAINMARQWPEMLTDDYYWLARASIETGDYPTALEAIAKDRELGDTMDLRAMLGRAYARMGDREKALAVLAEFEKDSSKQYVQPYFVAWVHAALGQNDEAVAQLEKAVEDRSMAIVHADLGNLRTDPAWDGLRDHPRYQALLKKVGLDVWPK